MKKLEKEFEDTFELLARKHSWERVWKHFLYSCMLGFGAFPEWQEEMKKEYEKKEREQLGRMVMIWIETMDKVIKEDGQWHDFFGAFWETNILGKHERSGGGVFFTPDHICDLSTMLIGGTNNLESKWKTVNDPTCGSGRMLLSSHVKFPGNYMIGQDINYVCCLMSVCNFIIHGVTGEVIHMDTLALTFYGAWRVDWNAVKDGGMAVWTIEENETLQGKWENTNRILSAVQDFKDMVSEPTETSTDSTIPPARDAKGQLELF